MTTVAVLGTGLMGSGMARSLARAGLDVRVWNRTAERARALVGDRIEFAADPAAAVRGADVVLTMLFDADAVEQVMAPLLGTLDAAVVWAQCATVGLDATDHLARLAESHGVAYVDAPVLGTRAPAEKGQLTLLAGAPAEVRERVAPVFAAIGARTVWVGERPGDGHRLKLTLNAWVLSVTAATAQSVGLAGRLGVEPKLFLETIAGGPMDCAYAQLKGAAMLAGDFAPAFSLAGAIKDAGLIERATEDVAGDARLIGALRGCFEAAARESGDADEVDMAAVVRAFG